MRGVANWVSKVIGRRLTFKSIARRVVFTKLANADEITLHDAAKHVGVQPRTLNVYHQKGKQVKSKAAMLLSKHNVAKEEEQSKAEPCPKPEIKAEPCPKPPQNPSPMKVKLESFVCLRARDQEMDNRQVSIYTISDDDLLSSHSCDVLNSSMVSCELSFGDEANEYEEFPPTQLSEKGDVFASLAEGVNEYRDAAFAAPPMGCSVLGRGAEPPQFWVLLIWLEPGISHVTWVHYDATMCLPCFVCSILPVLHFLRFDVCVL